MILIPQIYLKNGKVAMIEGTVSPLIREDALATARALADSGAEGIFCLDLNMTPLGSSINQPIVKKIRDELKIAVYVGGGFKTLQMVDSYMALGVELVVIGTPAYQQPKFLEDVCKKYPGKIAVHVDVKGSHVTIPGYTVVANKTAFDYADRFVKDGARFIFYSDVGANGIATQENFDRLLDFCKKVPARIICASEISGIGDIEKIASLGAPRLDGLVVARALYEGRIDLRGAITMVNDLSITSGDESTITEM